MRGYRREIATDWKTLLVVLAVVAADSGPVRGAGEPLTLSPDKPVWGQPLQVTYDPAADGAKLPLDQDAHLIAWCEYNDGWHEYVYFPMQRVDGRFVGEIAVDRPLCHISLSVANRFGGFDGNKETMIYGADGEPVRHAWASQIMDADSNGADALFAKEIALYPDNYFAYEQWWSSVQWNAPPRHEAVLRAGLAHIESVAKERPLDWQFARVSGYLDLHEEARAREIVLEMLKTAPEARFTYFAVRLYIHSAFGDNITGEGPAAVQRAVIAAIREHPRSPLARIDLDMYIHDDDFPADVLKLVADAWLADEPWTALPHFALAEVAKRGGDMATAYTEVRRAIQAILSAREKLPQAGPTANEVYMLPNMYLMWSQAALALGKYDEALVAASAVHSSDPEESSGSGELLEGKVWAKLGFAWLADRAFIATNLRDPQRGIDEMKALYLRGHGSDAGFETHRAQLLDQALRGKRSGAPTFSAVTMDGTRYESNDLRGKVVVLNFWFIGCGPCRAEMPDLNKLVDAFAERKDIVFLAPSHDDRASLVNFLARNRFAYQVIPEALPLNETFQVHGHPTHIIIDREGNIFWRQSGNMTFDVLKPMVDRALGASA